MENGGGKGRRTGERDRGRGEEAGAHRAHARTHATRGIATTWWRSGGVMSTWTRATRTPFLSMIRRGIISTSDCAQARTRTRTHANARVGRREGGGARRVCVWGGRWKGPQGKQRRGRSRQNGRAARLSESDVRVRLSAVHRHAVGSAARLSESAAAQAMAPSSSPRSAPDADPPARAPRRPGEEEGGGRPARRATASDSAPRRRLRQQPHPRE